MKAHPAVMCAALVSSNCNNAFVAKSSNAVGSAKLVNNQNN